MKFFLLIVVFIFSKLHAQENVDAYVLDSKTNKGIAYVNIGIIDKNTGTVSDKNGFFSLKIEEKHHADTIKFSMLGYKSVSYSVAEFIKIINNQNKIFLENQSITLNEVKIFSKELKEKILGNKTESSSIRAGFSSNELGNEVGIAIKVKSKPAYIQDFNVFIAENKYDTLKFRINIYNLKNGLPYENLLKESIVVFTTIKKGKLSVNLKKYNIVVEEDIFIALEWIENLGENGLYFSASLSSKPLIARHTSQGKWEKVGPISLGFNIKVLY